MTIIARLILYTSMIVGGVVVLVFIFGRGIVNFCECLGAGAVLAWAIWIIGKEPIPKDVP